MGRLLLLFSHQLTSHQQTDAEQHWGVTSVVPLPADIQLYFSNVPPAVKSIIVYAQPLKDWLMDQSITAHDLILLQGEYGLTYHLVNWCRGQGWRVLYATTPRQVEQTVEDAGTCVTRIFTYVRFRQYE